MNFKKKITTMIMIIAILSSIIIAQGTSGSTTTGGGGYYGIQRTSSELTVQYKRGLSTLYPDKKYPYIRIINTSSDTINLSNYLIEFYMYEPDIDVNDISYGYIGGVGDIYTLECIQMENANKQYELYADKMIRYTTETSTQIAVGDTALVKYRIDNDDAMNDFDDTNDWSYIASDSWVTTSNIVLRDRAYNIVYGNSPLTEDRSSIKWIGNYNNTDIQNYNPIDGHMYLNTDNKNTYVYSMDAWFPIVNNIANGDTLNSDSSHINMNGSDLYNAGTVSASYLEGDGSAITNLNIGLGAIVDSNVQNYAIGTNQIADSAINEWKIKTYAVTTDKVKDGAITSAKLSTNAVLADNIVAGAITAAKMDNNSVNTTNIVDQAITNAKLGNYAVNTNQIADSAVNEWKIKTYAVTTNKIEDGAVTGPKIATYAVSEDNIVAGAITETKMGTNSVNTTSIVDEAVTTAKLRDANVTTAKIANNAVTLDKVANNAINSTKIVDSCITNSDLAGNAISEFNIQNRAVTADKIYVGAVLDSVNVDMLDGYHASDLISRIQRSSYDDSKIKNEIKELKKIVAQLKKEIIKLKK